MTGAGFSGAGVVFSSGIALGGLVVDGDVLATFSGFGFIRGGCVAFSLSPPGTVLALGGRLSRLGILGVVGTIVPDAVRRLSALVPGLGVAGAILEVGAHSIGVVRAGLGRLALAGLASDLVMVIPVGSITFFRLRAGIAGVPAGAVPGRPILPRLGAARPGLMACLGGRSGLGGDAVSLSLADRVAVRWLAVHGIRFIASTGSRRLALAGLAGRRVRCRSAPGLDGRL